MTESGTTAVVTGGGRGIGLALARGLAAAGHRVLVTDIDEDAARAAAAGIGRGAWAARQDVRDPDSHRRIAAQAAAAGPLRVWVNNAGVMIAGDTWSHGDEPMTRSLEVNLKGVIAGSSAAVQAMGGDGGAILNLASVAALLPLPGLAVYTATKAAVLAFSMSLQGDLDHARLPIRVRALCPDVAGTAMITSLAGNPGAGMLFWRRKWLTPEQVARAGLELLDSRQLYRVAPRWLGLLVRVSDAAPAVKLKLIEAVRLWGEYRQRRNEPEVVSQARAQRVGAAASSR